MSNKWTLDLGANLIRVIHPSAFQSGYNLYLGGGVLNKGFSWKDLDILAVRRPQILIPSMLSTLCILDTMGFKEIKTDTAIPHRVVHKLKVTGDCVFKRLIGLSIDLIVIDLPGQENPYYHYSNPEGEDVWSKNHQIELEALSKKAILHSCLS